MDTFLQRFSQSPNTHAWFLKSPHPSETSLQLATLLEQSGPCEVVRYWFERLGIDDAREVSSVVRTKSGQHDRVFIFGMSDITDESQHMLLKTIEEPAERVRYIFVLPLNLSLLDTMQSRGVMYTISGINQVIKDLAHTFLSSTHDKRMTMITKMFSAKNTQEAEKKPHYTQALLEACAVELRPRIAGNTDLQQALDETMQSLQFLDNPGSSPKMILEHVALVYPIIAKD